MPQSYDVTTFPGAGPHSSLPITPSPLPSFVRLPASSSRHTGHTLAATHAHPHHTGVSHSGYGSAHRTIQPKKRVVAHHRPTPFGEISF